MMEYICVTSNSTIPPDVTPPPLPPCFRHVAAGAVPALPGEFPRQQRPHAAGTAH